MIDHYHYEPESFNKQQFIPEQYIVSVVSILCREPGDIECSEQSVGPVDIEIATGKLLRCQKTVSEYQKVLIKGEMHR